MSRGCTCTLSRLKSLETGDRLLPYGSGTLHLPGLEIYRPETRLKDYSLTLQKYIVELTVPWESAVDEEHKSQTW